MNSSSAALNGILSRCASQPGVSQDKVDQLGSALIGDQSLLASGEVDL